MKNGKKTISSGLTFQTRLEILENIDLSFDSSRGAVAQLGERLNGIRILALTPDHTRSQKLRISSTADLLVYLALAPVCQRIRTQHEQVRRDFA